jgi:lipopolysaccharide transport system ATP-binding protein
MSDIAIRVENLGKLYRIGGVQGSYQTFRDAIMYTVSTPFRRVHNLFRGRSVSDLKEEIWALKEVSFEVKHGEVVGIIGRNGAGKSTLLKILSRITEPTTGYADIYGRVGALLEVGTGFHPELTGRENIYLNGAILGMGRKEINRKFDEIVDFAGVEKFIDTPVKHYSSGMGLRLGFAVAAHLEPEILVVDEVLAVGDIAFQQKCLGKMEDVAHTGRTVLFVSHNMAAIRQLCTRGIILDRGRLLQDGATDDTINLYLNNTVENNKEKLASRTDRKGSGKLRFVDVAIVNREGQRGDTVEAGQAVRFLVRYAAKTKEILRNVSISIRVDDIYGQYLFTLTNSFTGDNFETLPPTGTLVCDVPSIPLVAGMYRVFLWCNVNRELSDMVEGAMQFSVVESDYYGSGKFPVRQKHGIMILPHSWNHSDFFSFSNKETT